MFLGRHQCGDWGDISPEGALDNEIAACQGLPVLSSYTTSMGYHLLVATEADRSATRITTPDEL